MLSGSSQLYSSNASHGIAQRPGRCLGGPARGIDLPLTRRSQQVSIQTRQSDSRHCNDSSSQVARC